MEILSVANVTKKFGPDTLFESITFGVGDKERVAIIGDNGTGKSTLLKIILGQEDITRVSESEAKGSISFAKGTRVGYLSQDVISSLDNSLRQEATLVFKDQIELEHRVMEASEKLAADPDNSELANDYGKKVSLFESLGGYDYSYKISMMLSKFGFDDDVIDRPIKTFSGGERTKMAFVKLLLIQPDLLVLDEPTNHLDISTIDWLEGYLKIYNGAILFVSHDRYFINSLATKIVEIENKTAQVFSGNFDSYVIQKKERFELMSKQYQMQQKEIEKIQRFITYFMPKPRFVSRAKDRVKKLEHMKLVEKPATSKKSIKFRFEGELREDKKIIYFDECSVGYDRTLVSPFSFYVFGGDKLAIMGDNGTGKTTLLKCILGELKPYSGNITRLMPLNIGYIQQNDFDLNIDMEVLSYMLNLFPMMGEKELRNHLGKFGFAGDDVFKSILVLSGGEKMRLIFAKIVLLEYDVLLLDEPTNHLDMITKEALVEAMQDYNACIIFVSHDRYFIDMVANKILYFSKGQPIYFEGNYDEFKHIESNLQPDKTVVAKKAREKTIKAKPNNEKKKIDSRISVIEQRLQEIEADQSSEELYDDYQKMRDLEIENKTLEDEYLLLLQRLSEIENEEEKDNPRG